MKKTSLIIGSTLLALILVVVCLKDRGNSSSSELTIPNDSYGGSGSYAARLESSDRHAMHPRITDPVPSTESREEENARLRRELNNALTTLDKLARPLEENVLSSMVNAEITPGETLATGGYETKNGNFEFIFLTPRSRVLEDGRSVIEIDARVLSVGGDFVERNGLGTLATNARNTLQHAEAWNPGDVESTLAAARGDEKANVFTYPRVTTLPSLEFEVSTGENAESLTLEATVDEAANGNFAIRSRIERSQAEQISEDKGQVESGD